MQKIIITGAEGRMGRALLEAVIESDGVELAGATVKPGSPFLNFEVGDLIGREKTGIITTNDLAKILVPNVIVIDFTVPEATLNHLKLVKSVGAKIVIGTTGFSSDQINQLEAFGESVPFVFAGNFSVGVNLTLQLLRTTAKVLGDSADIEVIEAHHKHKVDAPSGTALMMGEAAAEGLGVSLEDQAVFAREGITGARTPGTIGFSAIRGGDIVGEHTVMFACEGERVEISHKASSRQTFARGAVRASKWLSDINETGKYSMEDVLGFN